MVCREDIWVNCLSGDVSFRFISLICTGCLWQFHFTGSLQFFLGDSVESYSSNKLTVNLVNQNGSEPSLEGQVIIISATNAANKRPVYLATNTIRIIIEVGTNLTQEVNFNFWFSVLRSLRDAANERSVKRFYKFCYYYMFREATT